MFAEWTNEAPQGLNDSHRGGVLSKEGVRSLIPCSKHRVSTISVGATNTCKALIFPDMFHLFAWGWMPHNDHT